jgi:hypothetical protein
MFCARAIGEARGQGGEHGVGRDLGDHPRDAELQHGGGEREPGEGEREDDDAADEVGAAAAPPGARAVAQGADERVREQCTEGAERQDEPDDARRVVGVQLLGLELHAHVHRREQSGEQAELGEPQRDHVAPRHPHGADGLGEHALRADGAWVGHDASSSQNLVALGVRRIHSRCRPGKRMRRFRTNFCHPST